MKQHGIKATTLRTSMIMIIIIIIGASIVGFYYTQSWLSKFANEISGTTFESTSSVDGSQTINQLKDDIDRNKATASKAISITVPSKDYKNEITQDIDRYASNTDITIASYDFEQSASIQAVTKTSGLINGVQSQIFTVTLNSPVPFKNLMQFIKAIEGNLPKMQLKSIELSRVPNSDDTVTVNPLIIEVYTK